MWFSQILKQKKFWHQNSDRFGCFLSIKYIWNDLYVEKVESTSSFVDRVWLASPIMADVNHTALTADTSTNLSEILIDSSNSVPHPVKIGKLSIFTLTSE